MAFWYRAWKGKRRYETHLIHDASCLFDFGVWGVRSMEVRMD